MTASPEALRGVIPDEFLEVLLLLMPDAEAGPSPGESAYFPCIDPEALNMGGRAFWTEAGAEPDLGYELEVRIPAGALCARGTWLGPDPPGGVAVPQHRLWLADLTGFEVVRVVRRRPTQEPPRPEETPEAG